MSRPATYKIRIDEKDKQETFAVFQDLGITPAQAVKMFFAQVRMTHSIPFPIDRTYNEATMKLLLDNKDYSESFTKIEDLFADLNS